MFCGSTAMSHHSSDRVDVHRLYCRSWQCEECRPRRLRQLRDLAASGSPTTIITLTIREGVYSDPDEAAQALVHAWRMVLQRAKREGLASHVSYLAVFESTKKGMPHIHILARSPYLPQDWLSKRMYEYCGSPIVDIRRIWSTRHASRYIAKYVSKGPGRFEGCKRYWRSQDYQLRPTGWERDKPTHDRESWYHPTTIYALADAFDRQDYHVTWESENSFIAIPKTVHCLPPLWQAWLSAGKHHRNGPG